MKQIRPTALIILDGFGYSADKKNNAVAQAHTPNITQWIANYPHVLLQASGESVGLPPGYSGNSEVGHLIVGSGRIITEPLTRILASIADKTFFDNHVLTDQLQLLQEKEESLHIMCLLSDAGVHSHEQILYACITAALNAKIKHIILHLFLDGRDCPPQSAHVYLQRLTDFLKHSDKMHHVIIGSLQGRFYAMDRDNNWDRTEKSYRVLTEKQNIPHESWEKVLERNYAQGITDEFIPPTQLTQQACIKNGDGIIFCNTRPDRARQLTASFVQQCFIPFITKPLELSFFITPVRYGENIPTIALLHTPTIKNTLKDVLAAHNKTIFSIAETEKYAHVTYFFRGENEEPVHGEKRVMIPSIKTKNYIDHPEMSAQQITTSVLESLATDPKDFYLINYANADMVGHSGNCDATAKAIEILDAQLQQLYDVIIEKMDGIIYITADHGKAEEMYDAVSNQPKTAHTTNPVPFVMISKQLQNSHTPLPLSQLSDIAPFILKNMDLPIPDEME